jgi:protein-S-isoprenylcysteine O-methyltransferase Ste14
MGAVATVLYAVSIGAWVVFELILIIRDFVRGKGSTERDRGSRIVIRLALYATLIPAAASPAIAPTLRIPDHVLVVLVGVVVIWMGLAIRVWAVLTLGGSFRTTIEVDAGQSVVSRGPYRWIRHPSYTGLLLVLLGVGIGIGNWLAVAVCFILPPIALLYRIRWEEAELVRVLGDAYSAYESRTKRLIPGIW